MSSSVDNEKGAAIPSDHAMPGEHTTCYHYCGLGKFVSIVRKKELRLCNLFHMNDAKEVSWFFDIASKHIDDLLAGPEGDEGGSSISRVATKCPGETPFTHQGPAILPRLRRLFLNRKRRPQPMAGICRRWARCDAGNRP